MDLMTELRIERRRLERRIGKREARLARRAVRDMQAAGLIGFNLHVPAPYQYAAGPPAR